MNELTTEWVQKGEQDFTSADVLLHAGEFRIPDTACFHCHQCAEKAIKGWLVYNDQSFEKTHDLRLLVTLASEIEPGFTEWFDAAEQVSPYATAYRYPGETLEPTEDEFQQAFKAANRFYDFVCSKLPMELSAKQK